MKKTITSKFYRIVKRSLLILSVVMLSLVLSNCESCKEEKQKECEVVVLDWPKSIKDCITADEEKGLRDGTKKPGDVWKALIARCPDIAKDDNNYLIYSLATYPNAITVGSKEEVAKKLAEYAKKNKCCLKKITFAGHGRPGKISTGDGQRTQKCKYINGHPGNEPDWKKDLGPLKKILCKDATFVLRGCSVGFCTIGEFKMQEIAEFFGVTVVAPTINIKGDQTMEDIPEKDKKTIKPPVGEKAKPTAECDKEFDKKKKEEITGKAKPGIDVPFTGEIQAMGFYSGTSETENVPSISSAIELPISDQEWISHFMHQVDDTMAYDGSNESVERDAIIILQYMNGTYEYAFTSYGNGLYSRINEEGLEMMFSLSPEGSEMVMEGIERTLEMQ